MVEARSGFPREKRGRRRVHERTDDRKGPDVSGRGVRHDPARRGARLLPRAAAARGDQADRLLRALDDVALGELDEAAREGETPEGEEALAPGRQALDVSLRALHAAGSEADGRLVEAHPLDALKALVAETGADEVIVLTDPHYVEEFFHRDWASRARHKVGVPVLKLFSHSKD